MAGRQRFQAFRRLIYAFHLVSPALVLGFEMLDVPDQEDYHDGCHENSIEDVEEDLMRDKVSSVALKILDDSENASDKDNGARCVKNPEISFPRNGLSKSGRSRLSSEAMMEKNGGDDEEAKDADLGEKSGDDNLLAYFVQLQGPSSLYTSAASLECKGNDIARDKDPGHPCHGDQGQVLGVNGSDKTAEDHVYRSGVQRRCNKDKDCLNDEAADRELVIMTPDSTSVPNRLNYIGESGQPIKLNKEATISYKHHQ